MSIIWIGSNGRTATDEAILDEWGMTAAEAAELEQAAAQERQVIRNYLHLYVKPGDLPDWLEAVIVDHDYSAEETAYIEAEVSAARRSGISFMGRD